ncbi:MAG: hypothetical protein MSA50_08455 [Veillonellaceae bacterium]|nr:hypothetical protein [Veillonellaceae bacterium]
MEKITYVQLIMTIISAVATGFITHLWRKIDKREKEREDERQKEIAKEAKFKNAMQEGMQAMLRDHIIQTASKSMKQGYAQVYMVENMTHMFSSYIDLGGNGAVRFIFEKFMKLPVVRDSSEKGENPS